MPPCVIFEDEHLLVVNKPAGWNTHAPAPHAGEGIYDWLKHRELRWSALAIIHRLDKETSGVMVFGKTPLANRSLTAQFAGREVRKKYLLLTDRQPKQREFTAKSKILRGVERYLSGEHGEFAETRFTVLDSAFRIPDSVMVAAEPLTGRTHQIRVHAAENGFPILGDTLYGGKAFQRVCLHAMELGFKHPATGDTVNFNAPPRFDADASLVLRESIIDPSTTNAFRLIHGEAEGWRDWYVDRLGDFLLSQSAEPLNDAQRKRLATALENFTLQGVYHKTLTRQIRPSSVVKASPQRVLGQTAAPWFVVRENGVSFELSFNEGYSVGLFLDQRDNRRRFLTGHIAAEFPACTSKLQSQRTEVLNCFAYSCGFSVCAALGGARTTSLDLSTKYLEWGKRNFALNGLDPARHDFIYGDTFDWLKRLAKKGRIFDVVILDPPTFSQSKQSGVFRAEKDFGGLVSLALPLVRPGGVLFASCNAAAWPPEEFLGQVETAVRRSGRIITHQHYAPQPPDFPIRRSEPAYLKTLWLRVN